MTFEGREFTRASLLVLASLVVTRLHGRLDPIRMIVVGGCVGTLAALTFVAPMPLAVIGAVVAEYFGGSSDVLGRVIVQSSSRLRFDITWAAITMSSLRRLRSGREAAGGALGRDVKTASGSWTALKKLAS